METVWTQSHATSGPNRGKEIDFDTGFVDAYPGSSLEGAYRHADSVSAADGKPFQSNIWKSGLMSDQFSKRIHLSASKISLGWLLCG